MGSARDGKRAATRLHWGRGVAVAVFTVLLTAATPSVADEYDPVEAGHPVRIIAYALHPIGVILDVLVFRPAHWIASHEPVKTLGSHGISIRLHRKVTAEVTLHVASEQGEQNEPIEQDDE